MFGDARAKARAYVREACYARAKARAYVRWGASACVQIGPSFSLGIANGNPSLGSKPLGIANLSARELAQSAATRQRVAADADRHGPSAATWRFCDVWLVPDGRPSAATIALGRAADLIADSRYTEAAAALSKATLDGTPLAPYRQYYAGSARLPRRPPGRSEGDLRRADRSGTARIPAGSGSQPRRRSRRAAAALRRCGEVLRAADREGVAGCRSRLDPAGAREAGRRRPSRRRRGVRARLLRVSDERSRDGRRRRDRHAQRVGAARKGIDPLPARVRAALRLFGAARYAQARDAFDMLRPLAEGDEQEIAELRVAECDYYLKRYGSARDALASWTGSGPPPRRSPVLPSRLHPRARRACRVRAARQRARRRVPDRIVDRRHAEQPRHALHPDG